MSKVFRSPKSLTLLGGLVLSLLLIVTYLSVRAQQNADREIEIQLEKAAAPTNLEVDLPAYIAHRQAVLRERAAANPRLKAKAMIFFSHPKAPDAFLAMLNETEIPLNAIGNIYRGWEEFGGGFEVNEQSLRDFKIQSKAELVKLVAQQHREHISSSVRDMEDAIRALSQLEFKEPQAKRDALLAYQRSLERLQVYDAFLSQNASQFCSFLVERELQQLVQINDRHDVELVDVYLDDEGVRGSLSPFAIIERR